MADIAFLTLIIGFFAVCVLFVRGCERIIGPEPDRSPVDEPAAGPERDEVPA
jgi:hypothetical protein